jgi:CRISPR-associated exonuclease Cas4
MSEFIKDYFDYMRNKILLERKLKEEHRNLGRKLFFVHELCECSYKKIMREKFPDLELALIYNPRFVVGLIIENEIRQRISGSKVTKVVSIKGLNNEDIVISGEPDIITENKIIEVKYQTVIQDLPLKHHVLQLELYLWLFGYDNGTLLYVSPEGIKSFEVKSRLTNDDVISLIKDEKIPRWEWECSYCIFNQFCSYSVKKK